LFPYQLHNSFCNQSTKLLT